MSTTRATEALPFTLFENLESEKHPRTGQTRKRTMRFDINALADFEQETGMGFGQLMSTKALFATARALAWAGNRHEDKTMTVTGWGRKIQEFLYAGGAIDEVLTELFEIAKKQGAFGKLEEEPAYNELNALEDGNTINAEKVSSQGEPVAGPRVVPTPAPATGTEA